MKPQVGQIWMAKQSGIFLFIQSIEEKSEIVYASRVGEEQMHQFFFETIVQQCELVSG